MDDKKISKHESYGMLSFARTSCNGKINLFGCSAPQSNTIRLRISTADLHRQLNGSWYIPQKELIEVEMSYNQFAEAISNMNTTGVPVTLKHINCKQVADCPEIRPQEEFRKEFEDDINKAMENVDIYSNRIDEIMNSTKPLTKKEKEEIKQMMYLINRDIKSNLPFVQKQFIEQMDKAVVEAKNEFDGFLIHKLTSLGLDTLKNEFMIEDKNK